MTTNTAPIKWAQRSDSLYITIALADVKDESIDLSDSTLKFEGKSDSKDYELNIEFFHEVDSNGSTYKVLPRSVQMHVMKKDKDQEEFWPRLLKDKALEKNQVKIDWDRYVDEDEEDEAGGFDMSAMEGGMGMGGMPGMGGMGGMPGMGGAGGMDMEALMKQMGNMEGMGDLGAKMKEMEANGDLDDLDDDDDDDDLDDLPDLEE
eukprot:CAMPEP_0178918638 /NCGR_PEP_ID=MMETSP0786-20121207/13937_1 /TAXON_ID=186022 /ORGANISM="Thalassionema frauenfeldii, Strain CCMP 1798" /LENGTH=204 /DNA_ID=CAMNT_0020592369 /DNA_START=83 /DNA_END=697 /DNA_ORIENTATION=-